MTPEQFKERMQECFNFEENGDIERQHHAADELLVELIWNLSKDYGDGLAVFLEADKWYA